MDVRRITLADLPVVEPMILNTIRYIYCDFISPIDEYLSKSGPLKYIHKYFDSCYLFWDNDECKGLVILLKNQIFMLIVNIEYHRQGVGKTILQWCETLLFKKYDEIFLDSVLENVRAMTFYIKEGWLLYDIKSLEDSSLHITYFKKVRN